MVQNWSSKLKVELFLDMIFTPGLIIDLTSNVPLRSGCWRGGWGRWPGHPRSSQSELTSSSRLSLRRKRSSRAWRGRLSVRWLKTRNPTFEDISFTFMRILFLSEMKDAGKAGSHKQDLYLNCIQHPTHPNLQLTLYSFICNEIKESSSDLHTGCWLGLH